MAEAPACGSHFQMGPATLSVPYSLYKDNRSRLVDRLRARADLPAGAVGLFKGGITESRAETDHEHLFRQVCVCLVCVSVCVCVCVSVLSSCTLCRSRSSTGPLA